MNTPRVAALVSGTGRSIENLAALIGSGDLSIELALVLSDRPGAQALARAERLGVPTLVVPYRRDEGGVAAFSKRIFTELDERGCELCVLAGFLRLIRLPESWIGRVINIHPSLLPDFGGKGYYGDRVHRAVLEAGVAETGCTVHFVDNRYDTGPIILQRRIAVTPDDTVDSLAGRVFEEEKVALPTAIRRVLSGEARFDRSP